MEATQLNENDLRNEDDTLINERESVSGENSNKTPISWKKVKVLLTLFSIVLTLFDLITDFLTGMSLIKQLGGKVIMAFVFLPAAAAIVLGLYQHKIRSRIKTRQHTTFSYAHTLLDVNWFGSDEDERNGENEGNENTIGKIKKTLKKILAVFFFICRINSFKDYILYLTKLCSNVKKEKLRALEQRIRADEFLDAVFENLPQVCVQLHIFGLRSKVTHLQIISIAFSVASLVYKITNISITRELLIREETKNKYLRSKKLQRMFSLQPLAEENPQTSGLNVNPNELPSLGKISKSNDSEKLELRLFHKSKPSKKILINLEYIFDKENKYYILSAKNIRGKEERIGTENNWFYFIRIFQIFVEGFTFFIPTLPAVALFSSFYGRYFFFLYAPVAAHFIAGFWWWRIHTYKKRFTLAFHIVFGFFKFIERMFIIVLISVWFIKVIDYSRPLEPDTSCHIPSFIYPEPRRILSTIASYEKDGYRKDWAEDCYEIKADNMTIDFIRFIYSGIPYCAIYPSSYAFCIVYYMNAIGFFFDIGVFVAYFVYHRKFKDELGKFEVEDQRNIEDCHQPRTSDEQLVSSNTSSA